MNHIYHKLLLIIGCAVFSVVLSESAVDTFNDKNGLLSNGDMKVNDAKGDLLGEMERRADDFFLKASKSVPRIGRRGDDFFLKASKNIPRMGRRNSEFLKASKSVPRIGKKNNKDPFLIGVKTVPRIGRSQSSKEQNLAAQKKSDNQLGIPMPDDIDIDYISGIAKRSSYILSSYNDLSARDKQGVWSPRHTVAQEVEIGPPIYFAERL